MHIHWTMSEMMAVSILLCCYGYYDTMITLWLWLLWYYGYSVAMVTLLLWLLCCYGYCVIVDLFWQLPRRPPHPIQFDSSLPQWVVLCIVYIWYTIYDMHCIILYVMAAVIFGLLAVMQDFHFLMWMNRVGLCDHIAL